MEEHEPSASQEFLHNPGPIDVDADDDVDSTLGESVDGSLSASLASSIRQYKYENGRRYHAYREGEYPFPNDDEEQSRLDFFHHIFRLLLNQSLYLAPIAAGRILDVGTGTGIWAIDVADELPNAIVIGTDLSPIQPDWVPLNCKFYVDDAECEWMYSVDEHFDFIHGRGLCGAIGNFPKFYREAFQNLRPGGWIEMQEYEAVLRSDDNTIDDAPWINQLVELIDVASTRFGKKMNVAHLHKKWMETAGFVDVRDEIFKAPLGTWPKDPKLKNIGRYFRAQMLDAVEPISLAYFIRVLGYTVEQTQVILAEVRREMQDPKLHLYVAFHIVYGRKPKI